MTPIAPRQHGPSAWLGSDLAGRPGDWTWTLDAADIDELLAVSAPFADGVEPLPRFTADDVPLPRLGTRIDELRRELTHGLGFALVRGFPCAELPVRQAAAAFLAVGAHLGSARSQNASGHMLGHVIDTGADAHESAFRFADAPRRTAEMIAALDLFDEIANDPAVHLEMQLDIGDMQFVHNHSLLHDRTGFVNRPDAPRHLLRLWLSVAGDRALPPVYAQRYGSVTVGDRGGIVTAGTTLHAPVVP